MWLIVQRYNICVLTVVFLLLFTFSSIMSVLRHLLEDWKQFNVLNSLGCVQGSESAASTCQMLVKYTRLVDVLHSAAKETTVLYWMAGNIQTFTSHLAGGVKVNFEPWLCGIYVILAKNMSWSQHHYIKLLKNRFLIRTFITEQHRLKCSEPLL